MNGTPTMLLVELQYTLATEEAERIGVDHVARMSSHDTQESSIGWWFILCHYQILFIRKEALAEVVSLSHFRINADAISEKTVCCI